MLKLRGFTRETLISQNRSQIIKEFEKNLLTHKKIVYNEIVAVVGDNVKAVCTCSLSFLSSSRSEFRKDYHQRAVASGFFISAIASVLHTKVVHLHGWLGRKHRHQETPPVCRPALVKRLVKHLVQRW